MVETDYSSSVITDMTTNVSNYSVDAVSTDAAGSQKETSWQNAKWSQQLGYYKKIPELQKAVQALAIWAVGKGYTTDARTQAVLDNIIGWGEDTFLSIITNMLITKKIGGDAYAEIIKNEKGTLINLKPLDPGAMKIIVDERGFIKRYEQVSKTMGISRKFEPSQILHLCNDRCADEIHGTSVVDACEWVILARNEAMADWKKVLHRNVVPVRIIEVDSDNTAKMAKLKGQYEEVINKGEVIIVPKGNVEIKDSNPVLQDSLSTIKYYENFFYQAVGIPKIILGGSEEFTEASSKIGYLTFEQIYAREQTELASDLWNQMAIRLTFNSPASLKSEMLSSENKNTGQVAMQPNDMMAGVGE